MKSVNREYYLGVAAVLAASFLWGTTGVAATFAPNVSAIAIGAAAMGFGGILQASIAVHAIANSFSILKNQRGWILLGALAVAIYPLAFYGSMRIAGVTIGTVVSIGSAPILSAIIEIIMDKARVSARWLVGAGLGLAGVTLLSSVSFTVDDAATMLGVLLGVVAGLTYAIYSWVARRLMQERVPARAAMGVMFGVGGVLLLPILFMTGGAFLESWNNAVVGVYMAVVPMFLGYVCFGFGLARIKASMAITITLVEPVVAAALAAILVGERLSAIGWVGVGLIFACLLFVTWPMKRRN